MELIALISLGAVVLYQGILYYYDRRQWAKERTDLLEKIMSKDYTEYSTNKAYLDNYNTNEIKEQLKNLTEQ